jgi:hypothetical protein
VVKGRCIASGLTTAAAKTHVGSSKTQLALGLTKENKPQRNKKHKKLKKTLCLVPQGLASFPLKHQTNLPCETPLPVFVVICPKVPALIFRLIRRRRVIEDVTSRWTQIASSLIRLSADSHRSSNCRDHKSIQSQRAQLSGRRILRMMFCPAGSVAIAVLLQNAAISRDITAGRIGHL